MTEDFPLKPNESSEPSLQVGSELNNLPFASGKRFRITAIENDKAILEEVEGENEVELSLADLEAIIADKENLVINEEEEFDIELPPENAEVSEPPIVQEEVPIPINQPQNSSPKVQESLAEQLARIRDKVPVSEDVEEADSVAKTQEPPTAITDVAEVVGEAKAFDPKEFSQLRRDLKQAQEVLAKILALPSEKIDKNITARKKDVEQFLSDANPRYEELLRNRPTPAPQAQKEKKEKKVAKPENSTGLTGRILGGDVDIHDLPLALLMKLSQPERERNEEVRAIALRELERRNELKKENTAQDIEQNPPAPSVNAEELPPPSNETTDPASQFSEETYRHRTPDVSSRAPREVYDALAESKIRLKEGERISVVDANELRRNVLGARGTRDIEKNDERAARNPSLKDRVLKAFADGYPETVPENTLRQFSDLPQVEEYLKTHPLTQATAEEKNETVETASVVAPVFDKVEDLQIVPEEEVAGANSSNEQSITEAPLGQAEGIADFESTPEFWARWAALSRHYRAQAARGLEVPDFAKTASDDLYKKAYLEAGGDPALLEEKIASFDADAAETVRLYQRMQEEWIKAGKPYYTIVPVDDFYFIETESGQGWRFDTLVEAEEALRVHQLNQSTPEEKNEAVETASVAPRIPNGMEDRITEENEEPTAEGRFEIEAALAKSQTGTIPDSPPQDSAPEIAKEEIPAKDIQSQIADARDRVLELAKTQGEGSEDYKDAVANLRALEVGAMAGVATTEENVVQNLPEPLVAEQFKKTFNIESEALANIPEFAALSEGRKLLVHQELNNYAVSQIKTDALKEYRERYKALGVDLTPFEKSLARKEGLMGGLAKVAVGLAQFRHKETWQKAGMSMFKRKMLAEREKELAQDIFSGGIDQTEYIRELSRQASEGLDAEMKEGKLQLKFLAPEDFGGTLSPEQNEQIENFNRMAGAYASLPHSWKERNASVKDRKTFTQTEGEYQKALEHILPLFEQQSGTEGALVDANELERRITFTQFFNTHPEAAEQLADIKDQNVWKAGLLDLAKTRGGMMALGGTIRTAAAFGASQVLAYGSLVAAPLAGAVTGGVMGRKRAITELEERETLAKVGLRTEDNSAQRKQLMSELEAIRSKENFLYDANALDRITQIKEALKGMGTARNIVDAAVSLKDEATGEVTVRGGLVGKLSDLSAKIEQASEEEKAELVKQLRTRVLYSERKLNEGLINFGSGPERIRNQYELLRALAKAKGMVAVSDEGNNEGEIDSPASPEWRKDKRSTEERLTHILNLREQNISAAQKEYIIKTTKQAAMYGAAFAFGGALVAHVIHSGGGSMNEVGVAEAHVAGKGSAHFTPEQVAAIKESIQKNASIKLPDADVSSAAESQAKVLEEYMNATSDQEKNAIAHTMGMTRGEIEQKIGTIMEKSPSSPVSPVSAPENVGATDDGEVATFEYTVKPGENLTGIAREHLDVMHDLSPQAQANMIANFKATLSPEEVKSLGISSGNLDQIGVGEKIDVGRLNDLMLTKKIGGETLVEHAERLYGTPHAAVGGTDPEGGASHVSETVHASVASTTDVTPSAPVAASPAPVSVSEGAAPHVGGAGQVMTESTNTPAAPTTLHEGVNEKVDWSKLSPEEKIPLAQNEATANLTHDTDKIFGRDVFGNPSKEWLAVKDQSATVLSMDEKNISTLPNAASIATMKHYALEQGFVKENGYIPRQGETMEAFLRRAHAIKVLNEGPRPENVVTHISRPTGVSQGAGTSDASVGATKIVRAPYPGMEESVRRSLAPVIEGIRHDFGTNADRPAVEVLSELKASHSELSPPLESFVNKGYTPNKGESIIQFYERAMTEEALKTRIPSDK